VTIELPTGFLALPRANDRTLGSLRGKLGQLCVQTLASLRSERLGQLQAQFARLQLWLDRAPNRAAVLRAAQRVDVLAPTLALRSNLADPPAVVRELVPSLLLALARAAEGSAGLDPFTWQVECGRLLDPDARRVWSFDPPVKAIRAEAETLTLTTAEGASLDATEGDGGELISSAKRLDAFFPVSDGASPVLGLADSNPLALLEEHPDKAGNAISLGDRSAEEWTQALREALELIRLALPELHAELVTSLERIVPVGFDTERHLSASYREAPGLVYLTLHPSTLTMAEALVHETQHGKLNALGWFDAVLENGQSTWTESPVRPDLRPLWGVLLAVHAFVPVAALHSRLHRLGHPLATTASFDRRRADVLAANADGLSTLKRMARPTKVGTKVLSSLEALHAAIASSSGPGRSDATVAALG